MSLDGGCSEGEMDASVVCPWEFGGVAKSDGVSCCEEGVEGVAC